MSSIWLFELTEISSSSFQRFVGMYDNDPVSAPARNSFHNRCVRMVQNSVSGASSRRCCTAQPVDCSQ